MLIVPASIMMETESHRQAGVQSEFYSFWGPTLQIVSSLCFGHRSPPLPRVANQASYLQLHSPKAACGRPTRCESIFSMITTMSDKCHLYRCTKRITPSIWCHSILTPSIWCHRWFWEDGGCQKRKKRRTPKECHNYTCDIDFIEFLRLLLHGIKQTQRGR